jgi:hypothetical protein
MTINVGLPDRILRLALGIALLAFALGYLYPGTGWNWLGWIGVVPILTAVAGWCPSVSIAPRARCSALRAREDIHQFRNLPALLGLVAALDRAFDAVADMVAQDFVLDLAECGAHRRQLRENVDTIALVLNHAGKPADLPCNSVEAFERFGLGFLLHAVYIPP